MLTRNLWENADYACVTVKRLCRSNCKPVVFARSSGLSSLASSLTELDRICQ